MQQEDATRAGFLFQCHKPVIGMVHLLPLPGSSAYRGDGLNPILKRAVTEARTLADGGVDAILIQNTGDGPFALDGEPQTIAYMSVIGAALRREIQCPVGINILMIGAVPALAVAHAIDASFVRIKVYHEAVVTPAGVLTGAARQALAFRRYIGAEHIAIAADVYQRGSRPLHDIPIAVAAGWAWHIGRADALVVAGDTVEDSLARIQQIKAALPNAVVLAGGGTTADNVGRFLAICDGVIVGASIKTGGQIGGMVDPARLADYMQAVTSAR